MTGTRCHTEELRKRIGHLPKGLAAHIDRVVDVAVELAQRFEIDTDRVKAAALLHDFARVTKGDRLLELAREYGIPITPLDERMPVFLHGPVGAEIVRRELHIENDEVLEAVRLHTIGGTGMGPVAKVVYLADKIEPSKDSRYPFNSEVRDLAKVNLNRAILKFADNDISSYINTGGYVHPATICMRNDLLLGLEVDPGPN